MTSVLYAIEPARPMLGSSGFGGTGISAPGISCTAGSSHTQAMIWSSMTSCVLGPAAARRCFSMVRQYSSDQSWMILQRKKTATSSSCAACGLKKSWALRTEHRQCLQPNPGGTVVEGKKLTYFGASRGQTRVHRAYSSSSTM